jgi:hypothetical protein
LEIWLEIDTRLSDVIIFQPGWKQLVGRRNVMPKRIHVKGYKGVWNRDSTVPESIPPRPDRTFYIAFRRPGDRKVYDEKVGRKSEG